MAIPASLNQCAGRWTGSSRLQDPHNNVADDSPATAELTTILGGRFLRFEYTWAFRGEPQEGVLLIGGDAAGDVTAQWMDSWHMGNLVMACRGAVDPNGTVTVRGTYAAPPGPDWGWRIDLTGNGPTLRMVMFNVTPDGREDLAVEAEFRRADG